ncbi:MAG: Smr/MutS family protein [Candidatus Eiseniibacteriota bacterium]|jgi:hypothetical protein
MQGWRSVWEPIRRWLVGERQAGVAVGEAVGEAAGDAVGDAAGDAAGAAGAGAAAAGAAGQPHGMPPVVEMPIEAALDLHTFPPAEVRGVVEAYLEAAAERGLVEVRLIHGRGRGVQRRIVRSLLARHPLVVEFHDAPADRGGWGATVARLAVAATDPDRASP